MTDTDKKLGELALTGDENTPDSNVTKAFASIEVGHNSTSFVSSQSATTSSDEAHSLALQRLVQWRLVT